MYWLNYSHLHQRKTAEGPLPERVGCIVAIACPTLKRTLGSVKETSILWTCQIFFTCCRSLEREFLSILAVGSLCWSNGITARYRDIQTLAKLTKPRNNVASSYPMLDVKAAFQAPCFCVHQDVITSHSYIQRLTTKTRRTHVIVWMFSRHTVLRRVESPLGCPLRTEQTNTSACRMKMTFSCGWLLFASDSASTLLALASPCNCNNGRLLNDCQVLHRESKQKLLQT